MVVTWEAAMVMQMEMQAMEMHHGGLIHHKFLEEVMGLLKVVMVVGMAVLRPDKPNSSNFDGCKYGQ